MSTTGTIKTLFADHAKTEMIFPRTKLKAIYNDTGEQTLEEIIANMDARWAGAWIEFTDENGNPTNEPYLHFTTDENGNPIYTGIPYAEDGVF